MTPFIGRALELEQLASHLARVRRDGAGRLLTVCGPRQVGKSTLVERFLATVPWQFRDRQAIRCLATRLFW